MKTKLIRVPDRDPVDEGLLIEAAELIRSGGLVGFPTETVYGLGANALSTEAAERIYAAKGRPSDNPLIVHISSMEELPPLVQEIPEDAKILAAAFWPGPLTMIFRKSDLVPDTTSGGLPTVAVRMPSDPVARALIRLSGVPIAAPSGNLSGRPSPTTAKHMMDDMDGRIGMIIDGGPVRVGVESTIVDLTGTVPCLLRPGAVTLPMLEALLGTVELDEALVHPLSPEVHPKAPGMKYRHYAPKAQLTLYEGAEDDVVRRIQQEVDKARQEGKQPGVLATEETKARYTGADVRSAGSRTDPGSIARGLFSVLRSFDDDGVDVIFGEAVSEEGLGLAIMNRMTKAAGYHRVKV